MDNLQRIREKLQELVVKSNQERSEEDNPNHSDGFGMYWSGFCNCLKEIIPFVDSLPEEPVNKVWHDASEEPNGKEYVIAWDGKYASIARYKSIVNCKWCYLSDILPNKEKGV